MFTNRSIGTQVVIVGGGITGLATAHRLIELSARQKFPLSITLLEASDRLGGVIQSTRQNGFIFEGGPDSFLTEKNFVASLAQRLGIQDELISTQEKFRRSFIVRHGKLTQVPKGFYLLAPTRPSSLISMPLVSFGGRMRMALEPFVPKRKSNEDESVASFVRRRFGSEALRRIAQPMIGGIYAGNTEELSVAATLPKFQKMEQEHGSILKSFLEKDAENGAQKEASGPRYSLFQSFRNGMETLVRALERKLPPDSIRKNTRVSKIHFSGGEWKIELQKVKSPPKNVILSPSRVILNDTSCECAKARVKDLALRVNSAKDLSSLDSSASPQNDIQEREVITSDWLCLALPAYEAAKLVSAQSPSLSSLLESIPYESAATVNLAYRSDELCGSRFTQMKEKGFGFVVPEIEKRKIIGCTFSSFKFADRAPENFVLFRVFLGGACAKSILGSNDESLRLSVLAELRELLGIKTSPEHCLIQRFPNSMPQYRVGHLERVMAIEEQLKTIPQLCLAGNAYRGIGIPDCVAQAEAVAEKIFKEISIGAGSEPAHKIMTNK